MRVLQPAGWPRPKGYSNGIEAEGRLVFVGGQIGWDAEEKFPSDDFVAQVRQAFRAASGYRMAVVAHLRASYSQKLS